jgi:hypothetical protein
MSKEAMPAIRVLIADDGEHDEEWSAIDLALDRLRRRL